MMDESAYFSQEAIRINPQLAKAYSNLGNVFKEQSQVTHTLEYYIYAVTLKGTSSTDMLHLSRIGKEQFKLTVIP